MLSSTPGLCLCICTYVTLSKVQYLYLKFPSNFYATISQMRFCVEYMYLADSHSCHARTFVYDA